jgi:hypothetical protein
MAHSSQPRKVPGVSAGKGKKPARSPGDPDLGTDFRAHLDRGMAEAAKEGRWESWLHLALETGDPQFWPQIREFYHEQPCLRQMILFHLPFYWAGHEPMVVPLFRLGLHDPDLCDVAIRALQVFPSLEEDVLACLLNPECFREIEESLEQAVACLVCHPKEAVLLLRGTLRDPVRRRDFNSTWVAVQAASRFPALTDDVVACLEDPEIVELIGERAFIASLGCLLGLIDIPTVQWVEFEKGGEDPALWSAVEAELKRRYGRVPASLNVFES